MRKRDDYIEVNCWECFQSCGKVCQDNSSKTSGDRGNTICCGGESNDSECRNSDDI